MKLWAWVFWPISAPSSTKLRSHRNSAWGRTWLLQNDFFHFSAYWFSITAWNWPFWLFSTPSPISHQHLWTSLASRCHSTKRNNLHLCERISAPYQSLLMKFFIVSYIVISSQTFLFRIINQFHVVYLPINWNVKLLFIISETSLRLTLLDGNWAKIFGKHLFFQFRRNAVKSIHHQFSLHPLIKHSEILIRKLA